MRSPLRRAIFSIICPDCDSLTSSVTSSRGSINSFLCFTVNSSSRTLSDSIALFLNTTRGGDTATSCPSLLISSSRIPSCNSPLACTSHVSLPAVMATRRDTLVSLSFRSRSRMALAVDERKASVPASGELLGPNDMERVGGSMGVDCLMDCSKKKMCQQQKFESGQERESKNKRPEWG